VKQVSLMTSSSARRGRNEIEIIEQIRVHRNEILRALLNINHLKEYIFLHFRVDKLEDTQLEVLKRVVVTMIMSPLDLNRYCRLIRYFTYQENTIFEDSSELFFHEEIEGTFIDYIR
jgi:hypothetical protein